MNNLFLSSTNNSEREQRLLRVDTGDSYTNPFLQGMKRVENFIGNTYEKLTNPAAGREVEFLSDQALLSAFQLPNIFTDPAKLSGALTGVNADRLLAMEPVQRLQELESFAKRFIPQYAQEFPTPLSNYVTDKARINTILVALATVLGGNVNTADPNNTAGIKLGREALLQRQSTSAAPGRMFLLYERWLDAHRGVPEPLRTDPQAVMESESKTGELVAYLNIMDPADQTRELKAMYEQYQRKNTDLRLASLDQRMALTGLIGSDLDRQKQKESTDLLQNIEEYYEEHPMITLALAGMGAAFLWKTFKSENPLGRWALFGAAGYLAYDIAINGNQKAHQDLANNFKKGVTIIKGKAVDILTGVGLMGARQDIDRFEVMSKFFQLERLPVGPAQSAMAVLATMDMGTIEAAFTPNDPKTGVIGGRLDTGNDGFVKGFRKTMEDLEMSGTKKNEVTNYLSEHSESVGKAIAHVFYLLGAREQGRRETAKRIASDFEMKGSYDGMEFAEREQYSQIVIEGGGSVRRNYKNKSLATVIYELNTTSDRTRTDAFTDTAAIITDPSKAGRENEFRQYNDIAQMDTDASNREKITGDNGTLKKTTDEFVQNAQKSQLLNAQAAAELTKEFDAIRTSGDDLKKILETTEKLKYAIVVAATGQATALTQDQIIQMAPPDSWTASAILNTGASTLSNYVVAVPRGFPLIHTLDNVSSMLHEPLIGSGPLASTGRDFEDLKTRLETYKAEMRQRRDPKNLSKKIAENLPAGVLTLFDNKKPELVTFLAGIIERSDFTARMDRTEEQLSLAMAQSFARTMGLTATPDGLGRRENAQVVSPREIANLLIEFDVLKKEIVGEIENPGMWAHVEDLDLLGRYDLATLEKMDYTNEKTRSEAVSYARDLGVVYTLHVSASKATSVLKSDIGDRVTNIYDKILAEKEKELQTVGLQNPNRPPGRETAQINNLYKACLIENKPSFQPAAFDELVNVLKLLGTSHVKPHSFKTMRPGNWFPPNFEKSTGFSVPKFVTEFPGQVLDYWKKVFTGT